MLKKLVLAAAFIAAPNRCYPSFRAPVVSHRSLHHGHYGHHGYHDLYYSRRVPVYGYGYGYGVPYRGISPYGVYGGYPYYGRGSSIGVNRGGVSLYFGF